MVLIYIFTDEVIFYVDMSNVFPSMANGKPQNSFPRAGERVEVLSFASNCHIWQHMFVVTKLQPTNCVYQQSMFCVKVLMQCRINHAQEARLYINNI